MAAEPASTSSPAVVARSAGLRDLAAMVSRLKDHARCCSTLRVARLGNALAEPIRPTQNRAAALRVDMGSAACGASATLPSILLVHVNTALTLPVAPPSKGGPVAVQIKSITFDCADPYRLAQFWLRLIDWPQIDFQRSSSTYAMSTLVCYAPQLKAVVTGLT
jgi:hypothetical protein